MFPAIAAVLTLSAGDLQLPPRYFVNLFSVMYVCMAPILIISAIISEEKEKGSLRMLMMSNVKPMEYILGIGSYAFVLCMIGVLIMGAGRTISATGATCLSSFECRRSSDLLHNWCSDRGNS